MKKKIIVLLMTMTMAASILAGCGAESSNVTDNKKTETSAKSDSTNDTEDLKEDVDATENNVDASKEEDSQEANPFLGPNGLMFASEEDVEILVDGKPIKLKMTREELDKMVADYGYTIEDPKRVKSIYTSAGEIRVTISNDELMSIDLIPSLIDLSKVSINGVSLDKVKTLKNSSNLIEEKENGYFQISIADYTTLSADYNSEGELMVICLKRQQYSLR
nr:hypothetical protein [uncultured Agathobacter sp.]